MSDPYIRTYKKYDLVDVEKHLIVMGDLKADCGSCQELGLDPYTTLECPNCGTTFRFMASRRLDAHPGERTQFCKRMNEQRPELTIIDYSDYTKALGKKKARDFFG